MRQSKLTFDVTICTTNYSGFGTDYGKVSLMLFGEKEDTGLITMQTPPEDKDQLFSKSLKYRTTVQASDVGELRSIRLRHDNLSGVCKWNVAWVTIKTDNYYLKFKCGGWLEQHEKDKMLRADLFPVKTEAKGTKKQYDVVVMTGNFHGTLESQSDVSLIVYGENGDTGKMLLNPGHERDATQKDRIFGKTNKFHAIVEGIDVGALKSIRIVHDNKAKDARWKLDYVIVKTGAYNVKFRSTSWLDQVEGRLETQLDAPGKGGLDSKGKYEVKVKTGAFAGADTDASVFVIVYGAYGDTGKIKLDASKGDNEQIFRKNAFDTFKFTAVDVGHIHKIRIGHENDGNSSAWFINRVIVTSPAHDYSLSFTAKRWLTAKQGDKKTELDLYPVTSDNLGNNINYIIKVKTGDLPDCGTDADAFVQLHGNNGDTGRIVLENDEQRDLFERNKEDRFVLTAADVGHIHKISIGQNNVGTAPDWYVEEVSVEVPVHNYSTKASVQQWLKGETKGEDVTHDVKIDASNYSGVGAAGTNDNVILFDARSKTDRKKGKEQGERILVELNRTEITA